MEQKNLSAAPVLQWEEHSHQPPGASRSSATGWSEACEQAAHLSFHFLSRRRQSLSCVRLCDPMDCRRPGSSVHGILQARIQWVAIPFSRGPSHPGIKSRSPALQADSLLSEPRENNTCTAFLSRKMPK